MNKDMKFRDILAIPFWALAMLLDRIALKIGGVWTAKLFIDTIKRQAEVLSPSSKKGLN